MRQGSTLNLEVLLYLFSTQKNFRISILCYDAIYFICELSENQFYFLRTVLDFQKNYKDSTVLPHTPAAAHPVSPIINIDHWWGMILTINEPILIHD